MSSATNFPSTLVFLRPIVGKVLVVLFGAAFLVFLFGPLVALLLWSVARGWFWPSPLPTNFTIFWYNYALAVPGIVDSLRNSVVVAVSAVVVTTLTSLPAGYALARLHFPGKGFFRTLFLLPLMVPAIAIGIGVAAVFYRLNLIGTLPGIILAHSVATLPFGILILTAGFESLNPSVEEAAAACGAGASRRFITITLPLIAPAILAQAIYVFTISMDEFTLTLLLSSADTATLPVRIYGAIGEGYIQLSSALAMLLLLPSFVLTCVLVRFVKTEYLTMGGV